MNKALLICLCIIMLIGACIIGLTTFLSQAQALAGGIIIEDADYVANMTTEYSAGLISVAQNVTPRIVVEYGDFISTLDLYKSDDLNQSASTVTPRIIIEYADSITELGLQGSQDLIQAGTTVTPRIIVEYADSIFGTDLERPLFGAEVSARIDGYSISPRNVTVGDDVTIGFSFTNTGGLSWKFGAGATLRKPDGTQIDFLVAVTVNPSESESAQWIYTIDVTGRWDALFNVWKEHTHPLESLLDQTGWVDEYITATAIAVDNQPPVAVAGQDQTVNVGATVTCDAGGSSDNVGIVSYEWNFGDGTNGTGVIAYHTYTEPETYIVTLTVWDAAGNSDTDSITITVLSATPPPPPAEAFPLWIVGVAVAIIAIATAAIAVFRRRRKQPSQKISGPNRSVRLKGVN